MCPLRTKSGDLEYVLLLKLNLTIEIMENYFKIINTFLIEKFKLYLKFVVLVFENIAFL